MQKHPKLFFLLFLICLVSCDKEHGYYRRDPKGYTDCKDAILLNNVLPCPNPVNVNSYNIDIISDTAEFNYAFWGQGHGLCYWGKPTINLDEYSLIPCKFPGWGTNPTIEKSKVLIDNTNKKIICKFLVRMSSGACEMTFYDGFLIPKGTDDYEVEIQSWITSI